MENGWQQPWREKHIIGLIAVVWSEAAAAVLRSSGGHN